MPPQKVWREKVSFFDALPFLFSFNLSYDQGIAHTTLTFKEGNLQSKPG